MTMQYILADLLEPLQVELFEATPMGWVRRKPVQTYARQALTAAAAVAADQSLTRRGRGDRDHASGGGHPEQPEPAPEQAAQNNEDVRASTIAAGPLVRRLCLGGARARRWAPRAASGR